MELIETKCPNCHASIRIDPGRDEVTCEFCQHTFLRRGEKTGAPPRARAPAAAPDARAGHQARNIIIVVLVIMVLTIALVVGTCIFSAGLVSKVVSKADSERVKGTVTSKGGSLGDFSIPLSMCRSGEGEGFLGIDVFTEGDSRPRLRFLKDPLKGYLITVTVPGTDNALLLGQEQCKVLEGEISRHGYGGSGVATRWAVDGRLGFDCTHTSGTGHVVGSMTFHDCF